MLFAAVCRSMDANMDFRKEFNKLFQAVLSVNEMTDADVEKTERSATLVSPDVINARNTVRINDFAMILREIEQKALESAAAEWHTRAEISQVESLLTTSGIENVVLSARKLAEETSDE
jgi:hypothetical protein